MCGICGIALGSHGQVVDEATLVEMSTLMAHRGPDDQGVVTFGRVGLGHRRLSIVDLATGHQPMANEDQSIWVILNGEIYNHASFRSQLTAAGHAYRTQSDTECLLHLYEEYGWNFVRKLSGIFAFALWDKREQQLLLARDAVGVKPLYYARTRAGDLVFGSEVKALFPVLPEVLELDSEAVSEYFANGFLVGDRTLFHGVKRLRPGHVLIWKDGEVEERRYWDPDDWVLPDGLPPTGGDVVPDFWRRFCETVAAQLMSDVPLGVFLSGGLDSSLVVAAMKELGVQRVSTFSVGFDDPAVSELPHARLVARFFGTDHHEVVMQPRDYFEQLPDLTWFADLPLRFPASGPLYVVSQLARQSVTVVLAGEGSDELFAGYGRYPRGLWNLRAGEQYARLVPEYLRDRVRISLAQIGDGYLRSRLRRSFLGAGVGYVDLYLEAFGVFRAEHRQRLLPALADTDAHGAARAIWDDALYRRNPLEALLRFDQATYLEELLMKQDKMSMACSIESRVPFLDQALVAWAGSLPAGAKLRNGRGKQVVRVAAKGRVPPQVLAGPKRGFSVPVSQWLRGIGRPWLEEYLPRTDEEPLDGRYVRELIRQHTQGIDHAERLWLVLAFQVWRRTIRTRVDGTRHQVLKGVIG